ncbi:hypothetical protein [Rhizobium mesoamericanum]|uniref:hypothetical protein n=1 Tax=Rhizobium mesoamericanum TaxID=1079800 RepID=UPI0002E2200F|nr:hypothetical protein [Rhizobium mesoamericanum]
MTELPSYLLDALAIFDEASEHRDDQSSQAEYRTPFERMKAALRQAIEEIEARANEQ